MPKTLLRAKDLHVYYGKIHALQGVSFEVQEGEIVSLIGSNGAGKTTTLHALSGLLSLRSGEISFRNQALNRLPAHKIQRLGLAHVPEGRRIFTQLTVEDNLLMGAYNTKSRHEIQADLKKMYTDFPRLEERRRQVAGTLSGGEQQMLAIARARMSHPGLLLLDEPSMGLSPLLVQEIFRLIRRIQEEGCTILLVEQNAQMALCLADRAYVLESGRISLEGPALELLHHPAVMQAYLGA